MIYEVIGTGDGSSTIWVPELNETFHSRHGAASESRYVFIRHGFRHWLSEFNESNISILEIGFGTGLNVFLTLNEANKFKVDVRYTSLDPYPLPREILGKLNYREEPGILSNPNDFDTIHESSWDQWVIVNPHFRLYKMKKNLEEFSPGNETFDVVYFDAFAPSKQPSMWSPELIGKTIRALNPGGIWVTYSAKGQLKRDLRTLGLIVETLPGPPGKKEMIRGSVSL